MKKYSDLKHKKYTMKSSLYSEQPSSIFLMQQPVFFEYDDETKDILLELGIDASTIQKGEAVTFEVKNETFYIETEYEPTWGDRFTKREQISNREAIEMGYPKEMEDLTTGIVPKGESNPVFYFDAAKYFGAKNLNFIFKIIPESKWEQWSFGEGKFQSFAQKIHEGVSYYNTLSPKDQYHYDKVKKKEKKIIKSLSATGVTMAIMLIVMPTITMNMGNSAFNAGDYGKAKTMYSLSVLKPGNKVLTNFAAALEHSKKGEHDKGLQILESIQSEQGSIKISITEGYNRITYQKALSAYDSGDYKTAMDSFALIKDFSNSKDYHDKAGYALGDKQFLEGDIVGAIDSFYKVSGYEDAKNRADELSLKIYNEGIDLLNKNQFDQAEDKFLTISSYGFRNSADMANQSIYQKGKNLLNEGKTSEAITVFNSIYTFKDSSALIREATYRLANQDLKEQKLASGLLKLIEVGEYKDASTLAKGKDLALFGTLSVSEKDGKKVAIVNITFDEKGQLKADGNLSNIAISNKEVSLPYKYQNGEFKTESGEYTIKITSYSNNEVDFEAIRGSSSTKYKAIKNSGLDSIATLSMNEELTDDQKIAKYLSELVDKSTDMKQELDGEKIDISYINNYFNEQKQIKESE